MTINIASPGADAASLAAALNDASGDVISSVEFGLVPDSANDQSSQMTAFLEAVLNDTVPHFGRLAPGQYKVASTVEVVIDNHRGRPFGINAYGAEILSTINNASSDVLRIIGGINTQVRELFINGLSIIGAGTERDGLVIGTTGLGSEAFYNHCIRDVNVQGVGRDGLVQTGNTFENSYINPRSRNCGRNGMTWTGAETDLYNPIFAQNGQYGLELTDNRIDIRIYGGHILNSDSFGIYAPNGISLVCGTGLENNHDGAAGFSEDNQQCYILNEGRMVGCWGGGNNGKVSGLATMYVIGTFAMLGCKTSTGTLYKPGGEATGQMTILGCQGSRPSLTTNPPYVFDDIGGLSVPMVVADVDAHTIVARERMLVYTGTGGHSFTMPNASSQRGQEHMIKHKGSGTLTVDATSLGQIVDLSSSTPVNTISLTAGQAARLVSDGTNWLRI